MCCAAAPVSPFGTAPATETSSTIIVIVCFRTRYSERVYAVRPCKNSWISWKTSDCEFLSRDGIANDRCPIEGIEILTHAFRLTPHLTSPGNSFAAWSRLTA